MNKIEQLKSERRTRIRMYRKLIESETKSIASNDGFLCVEGKEIPIRELINIHAGYTRGNYDLECRWFYKHGSTGTVYLLSAWYDLENRLSDVQTKTIEDSDLLQEMEKYSVIIPISIGKPLLKLSPEEKSRNANRIMKDLINLLSKYSYCASDISYSIDPHDCNGGTIIFRFLHNGILENQSACILIRSIYDNSFYRYLIEVEGRELREYRIYVNSMEEIISACPKVNRIHLSLLHFVLHYIDHEMGDDFMGVQGVPTIQFLIISGIFIIRFDDSSGTPISSNGNCNLSYCMLTAEDYEIGDYLLSLNTIKDNTQSNSALLGDIIEFSGFEKFGYILNEKRFDNREKWRKDPKNSKYWRKEKIQRILDYLN